MGDAGSLSMGATLAVIALITGQILILPLIGLVFVVETVSVILQVGYFKLTGGKRIFRMAPLHHHFELGGWAEDEDHAPLLDRRRASPGCWASPSSWPRSRGWCDTARPPSTSTAQPRASRAAPCAASRRPCWAWPARGVALARFLADAGRPRDRLRRQAGRRRWPMRIAALGGRPVDPRLRAGRGARRDLGGRGARRPSALDHAGLPDDRAAPARGARRAGGRAARPATPAPRRSSREPDLFLRLARRRRSA